MLQELKPWGGSLLYALSALDIRHLPQITSEMFVPFTFTTSPFSSQLQGRTRPRNHSSNPSSGNSWGCAGTQAVPKQILL